MPGGLIQLITTGIQDSPLMGNPEITFFKNVYKRHTPFSICQNEKFIGRHEFNKESSKIIEKSGDLLSDLYLKIEIPYFEIIRKESKINTLLEPYNINELSVTYKNMDSIMIYIENDNINEQWYLIPKKLFKLLDFDINIEMIDSSLISDYVLPDYVKTVNYDKNINYCQILDNPISSLINLLYLNSSYWEQYWLKTITTNTALSYNNTLLTLQGKFNFIYSSIKQRIYNLYWKNNHTNLNYTYFNIEFKIFENGSALLNNNIYVMKTETERYFEYVDSIENAQLNPDFFDIDIVYKYCDDNFLTFTDYRDDILNNNSKCLLLILSILYSNNTIIYTFWKKYNTSHYNKVNISTTNNNTIDEWTENFNILVLKIFGTNSVKNIIFKEFETNFFNNEQIINNIFNELKIENPTNLYIKLKTIEDRFNLIPNYQINFNKGFLSTNYIVSDDDDYDSLYNQDNYYNLLNLQTNKYSILNKISTTLSENENDNLTPVDIINIYNVIANQVLDNVFDLVNTNNALKSFIVLWRNVVVNRLYSNYLDVFNNTSKINDIDRKLTFYHNIIPGNMFSSSEFKSSYNEMFFKNSWFGSVSIGNNDFLDFKENVFKVEINTLGTDFTDLIPEKNVNKLSITNTYTFIYYSTVDELDYYGKVNFKKVIYDDINKLLYIKYDNIYNSNTSIVLTINGTTTIPTNIYQKNSFNEFKFNSIYLVFSGILSCPYNSVIILTVTFINYIPALYFYQPDLEYASLTSNKYYLLTKHSNNKIKNKFINNNYISEIPSSLINNKNITLLTINYQNNMLVKPDISLVEFMVHTTHTFINYGTYIYGISYYTKYYESEISSQKTISYSADFSVNIFKLPISENTQVIGRRIYRTKANENKFYLLFDLLNNETIELHDNINDEQLGIDYNINNNIKYKLLPINNIDNTKIPIKINSEYQVETLDGEIYTFPLNYDNIYEIYIETFNNSVTINDSETLTSSGIYTTNNALLKEQIINAGDAKIFNYLVNSSNLMDIHKLIYSKKLYPFNSVDLLFELDGTFNTDSLITSGSYYYCISLYNSITDLETFINNDPQDSITTITITSTMSIKIYNFPKLYDDTYNSYKIFRSKELGANANSKDLYYITTISNITENFIDNIPDSELGDIINEPVEFNILDNISQSNIYNEVNIQSQTCVPNLYPFISHTTDCNFINSKGMSDINDFLFNKPFIMMSNNTDTETFNNSIDLMNSFTTPNLYFYNIPFKINSTSIITLNDKVVNYLLPISSQEFFYKRSDDIYYNIENNTKNIIDNEQITELYFNPSFDEFNLFPNFLNNKYYASTMIDIMINEIDSILSLNIDYKTIVDTIDLVNNTFINTCIPYLNSSNDYIYGNMSKQLISWIDELNKFNNIFNNKTIDLPIITFNNSDYFNYSHDAIRYIKDSITFDSTTSDLVKFSRPSTDYLENIKILSPVFTKFSSYNKISSNLYDYLINISSFYTNQIEYINDNIDYLNLMNPNIYIERYFSTGEFYQNLNDIFYTKINNTFNTLFLFPILEIPNDLYIDNKYVDKFTMDISTDTTHDNYLYKNNNVKEIIINSNNIDFFPSILQENPFETSQETLNRTTYLPNIFNYVGILNINNNNEITFDNQYNINNDIPVINYYKFDDNNIYQVVNNKISTNVINNNLTDFIVVNPYEVLNLYDNPINMITEMAAAWVITANKTSEELIELARIADIAVDDATTVYNNDVYDAKNTIAVLLVVDAATTAMDSSPNLITATNYAVVDAKELVVVAKIVASMALITAAKTNTAYTTAINAKTVFDNIYTTTNTVKSTAFDAMSAINTTYDAAVDANNNAPTTNTLEFVRIANLAVVAATSVYENANSIVDDAIIDVDVARNVVINAENVATTAGTANAVAAANIATTDAETAVTVAETAFTAANTANTAAIDAYNIEYNTIITVNTAKNVAETAETVAETAGNTVTDTATAQNTASDVANASASAKTIAETTANTAETVVNNIKNTIIDVNDVVTDAENAHSAAQNMVTAANDVVSDANAAVTSAVEIVVFNTAYVNNLVDNIAKDITAVATVVIAAENAAIKTNLAATSALVITDVDTATTCVDNTSTAKTYVNIINYEATLAVTTANTTASTTAATAVTDTSNTDTAADDALNYANSAITNATDTTSTTANTAQASITTAVGLTVIAASKAVATTTATTDTAVVTATSAASAAASAASDAINNAKNDVYTAYTIAYNAANTTDATTSDIDAMNAAANVVSSIDIAVTKANTAVSSTNAAMNAANAVINANAAKTAAANVVSSIDTAVTKADTAVSSTNAAMNAAIAVINANAAKTAAANVVSSIDTAVTKADTAVSSTNAAMNAANVVINANAAKTAAANVVSSIDTAVTKADTAVSSTNAAMNAAIAVINANAAKTAAANVVSSIDTAVTKADTAVSSTNAAMNAANAVINANAAKTAAANVVSFIDIAVTKADTAVSSTNAAMNAANAVINANNIKGNATIALNAIGDAVESTVIALNATNVVVNANDAKTLADGAIIDTNNTVIAANEALDVVTDSQVVVELANDAANDVVSAVNNTNNANVDAKTRATDAANTAADVLTSANTAFSNSVDVYNTANNTLYDQITIDAIDEMNRTLGILNEKIILADDANEAADEAISIVDKAVEFNTNNANDFFYIDPTMDKYLYKIQVILENHTFIENINTNVLIDSIQVNADIIIIDINTINLVLLHSQNNITTIIHDDISFTEYSIILFDEVKYYNTTPLLIGLNNIYYDNTHDPTEPIYFNESTVINISDSITFNGSYFNVFNDYTDTQITIKTDSSFSISQTMYKYLYKIQVVFGNNHVFTENINTNIYINLNLVNVDIIIIDDFTINLILLIPFQIINIVDINILYQKVKDDVSTWMYTSEIIKYSITLFKEVGYYITSPLIVNKNSIYYDEEDSSVYYNEYTVVNISDSVTFNGSYFSVFNNNIQTYIVIKIKSNITFNLIPTMIIQNNEIYSYYTFNDYTKKINNIPKTNYVLLIDTKQNIHYMLTRDEISTKIIPYGNYHTFILPKDYLGLIKYTVSMTMDISKNISFTGDIPQYSYYLIKTTDNSCIYYYETGNIMYANGVSTYFNLSSIDGITEIWLVDSGLFKTNQQLLSISTTITASEDNIDGLLLNITNTLNINHYDENVFSKSKYYNLFYNSMNTNIDFQNDSNECIVKILLQYDAIYIIYPVVVTTEINTYNPVINNGNGNYTVFPFIITNLDTGDFNIGTLDNTYGTYETISTNIILETIGSTVNISLNNYTPTNNELVLWKLSRTQDGIKYKLYFWTFFILYTTENYQLLYDAYFNSIDINYQPYGYNSDIPITTSTYITSVPNIFIYNTLSLSLSFIDNTISTDSTLKYKYYTNTRDTNEYGNNDYQIKELDFNSIYNIKPVVEALLVNINNNENSSTRSNNETNTSLLNKHIIYYILSYLSILTNKQVIIPYLKTEFDTNYYSILTDTDISFLSIYFSINYPLFVNNNITLINIDNLNYQITSYSKLYLEMNEIIILDGNYFIVNGLNVFNDFYELSILRGNNTLTYMYTGYYTLGNYMAKDNNIIPSIKQETMMYYKIPNHDQYELLFNDSTNEMSVNTQNNSSTSVINTFNKNSLKFNLFFTSDSNVLYLFDNFIKLKIFDYIIIEETSQILKINAIIDNKIYLNDSISSILINTFLVCYLPYQPFEIVPLYYDSDGKILSETIDDYDTLILDDFPTSNIQQIINNTLPDTSTDYNGQLVKVWKTKYNSNYNNIMYIAPNMDINININNIGFNNKHAIEIDTIYSSINLNFEIVNNSLITDNDYLFELYYLQPVKINGTYNNIKTLLKVNDIFYITLLYDMNITTENIKMIISPSIVNKYDNYLYQKVDCNFCIQPYNFYSLKNNISQFIQVTRYVIEDDKLLLIQTLILNKKIIFTYGVSIEQNEIDNNINDNYSAIYFYNSYQINSDGTISKFDTLIGSYHLITYFENYQNYVHLVKIIFPNKLFFYSTPNVFTSNNNLSYESVLDNLPTININKFGDFTYSNIVITQSRHLLYVNKNECKLIYNYDIITVGAPEIIDNKYNQQITFTTLKIIDTTMYNVIYIDKTSSTSYSFSKIDNKYYIISDNYLSNNFNVIYTISLNYIVKLQYEQNIKSNIQINDIAVLHDCIETTNINNDILVQNIQLTNIDNTNNYNYKLLNNTNDIILNTNETYKINSFVYDIEQINNSNFVITTLKDIDNDILHVSNMYTDIKLLVMNKIDKNDILYTHKLFPNINELKILLFNNSKIDNNTIYNNLKPWASWSLLNSINKVPKLEKLVVLGYIDELGEIGNTIISDFSYLTNNEIIILTAFINSINSSDIKNGNYYSMIDIELIILNNLGYWLNNPDFFMNVKQNINDFLYSYDIVFNGTNIIFNNDLTPDLILIDGIYEISGYISNEFTYDGVNKVVYRSVTNYNNINIQILYWINKINNTNFGINIHKLLRYLVQLGDELIKLINNFSNNLTFTQTPEYNNPLKFIINKIWDNNFNTNDIVKNLNTFEQLQYNITFENPNDNLVSSTEYLQGFIISKVNLKVDFNKLEPDKESNFTKIVLNEPYSNIPKSTLSKIIINPLIPYSFVSKSNIIKQHNNYSLDFLNGANIVDTVNNISYTRLTENQIYFYSKYNIINSDFVVIKELNSFEFIKSTLLGTLYDIYFTSLDLNYEYINNIYYNNLPIIIISKDSDNQSIKILSQFELTNYLEQHTITEITSITTNNTFQYIEFNLTNFNFIEDKTMLKNNSNIYNLKNDENGYYIDSTDIIESFSTITIITLFNIDNIINLQQTASSYELNTIINDDIYNPNYFEFNIINSNDQTSIIPINVYIVDPYNIIFYYNESDYNSISYYSYYFNFIHPSISSTVIYLFTIDINIDIYNNDVYFINIISKNKTSSYFKQKTSISGTRTFFNYPILYNNYQLNNIGLIQHNIWNVSVFYKPDPVDVVLSGTVIIFLKPNNFILDTTKTIYKVNEYLVTNIFFNNTYDITVQISDDAIIGNTFEFNQYYIETDPQINISDVQPNYNIINYNKRLGENSINDILTIENTFEYLYYFNLIIPRTTLTTIYLYDTTFDTISNTYELEDNTTDRTAIYINNIDTQTFFTTKTLYTNDDLYTKILFVQKNEWEITDFTILNSKLSFTIPTDFILNKTNNYHYVIHTFKIDSSLFIFSSNTIIMELSESEIIEINELSSIYFKQYYIETDNSVLMIPLLNTIFNITYTKELQYSKNDNFYMIPYSPSRKEFDEYLYIINTEELTSDTGFMKKYNGLNNTIALFNNGITYNGKIYDEYHDTFKYYIISLSEQINIDLDYSYIINDNDIIYIINDIQYYQKSLQYGDFYKQVSLTSVFLFMNNSMHEYNSQITLSNYNKFYLITYESYNITNLYDGDEFIKNEQMKREQQSTIINNTTIETPIFNDYSKLFNSYSLYFNDQLLEEINEDVININKNLYLTENQRQQLVNMTQIRFTGTSWQLYMPLIFWFCNKPGLTIPSIALPHTDIILKYKLNDLETFISNDLSGDYSFSTIPNIKITLITDFVLLDTIERNLFASYSHEYIIERYKIYPNEYLIKQESSNVSTFLSGLIKDIYLISKILSTNLNYYVEKIDKYDYKYKRYTIALEYYNLFIINNVYTSIDQSNYMNDIEIIKINMIELNNYNTTGESDIIELLYNQIPYLDIKLLKYLMYYQYKYLSKVSIDKQNKIIRTYLQYEYSNKLVINKISPLETLSINMHGKDLFAMRDDVYYNSVIPYIKFKNSLPIGYYTYTFSLYPREDQHSGHLNFANSSDVILNINSNNQVNNNPYLLNMVVKEYNIIRIMSGIGSLAWI